METLCPQMGLHGPPLGKGLLQGLQQPAVPAAVLGGQQQQVLPVPHAVYINEQIPRCLVNVPLLEGRGPQQVPLIVVQEHQTSDNRKFKFHVVVCACRHLAGLGYYIPHLRTRRDTALDEDNIAYVAEGLARFLPLYLEQ